MGDLNVWWFGGPSEEGREIGGFNGWCFWGVVGGGEGSWGFGGCLGAVGGGEGELGVSKLVLFGAALEEGREVGGVHESRALGQQGCCTSGQMNPRPV